MSHIFEPILAWDGSSWNSVSSGTSSNLAAVWASDATHVWAVGSSGTIVVGNGRSFSAQSSGTANSLASVFGLDANHLCSVGSNGTILEQLR